MGARRFAGSNLSSGGSAAHGRRVTPGARLAALVPLLLACAVLALMPAVGVAATDHGGGPGAGPFKAQPGEPRAVPGPEVPGLRTRTSRTYQDGDSGQLVARIAQESLHYQDGQAWKAISNDLVASQTAGYVRRNEANDYQVELPADLSGAPIRVSRGPAWASLRLVGARGAGVFAGRTAKYSDVLPGGVGGVRRRQRRGQGEPDLQVRPDELGGVRRGRRCRPHAQADEERDRARRRRRQGAARVRAAVPLRPRGPADQRLAALDRPESHPGRVAAHADARAGLAGAGDGARAGDSGSDDDDDRDAGLHDRLASGERGRVVLL